MNHKHVHTLEQIFRHPISMNMRWKDITHMLEALGAELETVQGGREKVRLNGIEHTFHIPHGKNLDSKAEITQLKHFLDEAGVAPKKS